MLHLYTFYKNMISANESGAGSQSAHSEPTIKEIVAHLEEDNDYVDIYQMLAFGIYTHPLKKAWLVFRCFAAFGTQFFAVFVIVFQELLADIAALVKGEKKCDRDASWSTRVLMSMLILCVIIFVFQEFYKLNHFGGYRINKRNLHNKPDFINGFLLLVGYYVNILILVMMLLSSIAVIWKSTATIDRILNAVAVFFILELDNMLVSKPDIAALRRKLRTFQHFDETEESLSESIVHVILYYAVITLSIAALLFCAIMSVFIILLCPDFE